MKMLLMLNACQKHIMLALMHDVLVRTPALLE